MTDYHLKPGMLPSLVVQEKKKKKKRRKVLEEVRKRRKIMYQRFRDKRAKQLLQQITKNCKQDKANSLRIPCSNEQE